MLIVVGGIVLLVTWLAVGRPKSWKDWLAGVDFSSSGASVGMRDATGSGPAYLGDGKAKLGAFSIRIFNPASRTTLQTDFRLEGRTDCPDEEAFGRFIKSNNRFFREQVTVTLRNCDAEDLADPRLRMLEKKLVSRVNRALDRHFLKSAQIKDFSLYESVDKSGFVELDPADLTAAP